MVWTCLDAAKVLAEEGIECEVVDPRTFRTPGATARTVLLLTAVRFPSARLIDNLPVRLPAAAAGPGRGRRRV